MIKLNKEFLIDHNIKAAIFDMDGLLIDSEPFWQKAEVEVFNSYGIPIDEKMASQTMGFRVDEVVDHWNVKYGKSLPREEVSNKIVDCVISLVKQKGAPLLGVHKTMEFFKSEGLPIAIASSSFTNLIDAVVEKLDIGRHLALIHSAEHEEFGKPHPAVFLTAAKKLGTAPAACLVFEDSINGIVAAKAAKMKCIAVPSAENFKNPKVLIADFVVASLNDLH